MTSRCILIFPSSIRQSTSSPKLLHWGIGVLAVVTPPINPSPSRGSNIQYYPISYSASLALRYGKCLPFEEKLQNIEYFQVTFKRNQVEEGQH